MTAKLPKVEIKKTKRIMGRKTKESMQSGIFHGYVGLVDHIVNKIRKEVKTKPKVIATGGLAPLIAKSTKTIEAVAPFLTLEGLRLIWNLNFHKK
jgi:type III pantothenate kinase